MSRRDPTHVDGNPLAYFLTFRSYGTWLPGDDRTWVDREHNGYDTPRLDPNSRIQQHAREAMKHDAFVLSPAARLVVDQTLRDYCQHVQWTLRALNVRSNHVHIVVGTGLSPGLAMGRLKTWSAKALKSAKLASPSARVWATGGSERWLWNDNDISYAWDYVTNGQDGPFEAETSPCASTDDVAERRGDGFD